VSTTPARRSSPLPLLVRDAEIILSAGDTNRLIDGFTAYAASLEESARESRRPDVIADTHDTIERLRALAAGLATPSNPLTDPPFELEAEQARLVRRVLADMSGYQRGDLTPALVELQQLVASG
jgi:hypothetical protein